VLRARLLIATGAWRAAADFELEPGWLRLLLDAAHWDRQEWIFQPRLRVLECRGACSDDRKDEDFAVIFETNLVDVEEFSRAALDAAKELRDRHGYEGYDALWTSTPFPVRALAALETALSVNPLSSKHGWTD